MTMQPDESQMFDELFEDFEVELLEVIAEMTEAERTILSQADDLPECISEILDSESSYPVAKQLEKKKQSTVAA